MATPLNTIFSIIVVLQSSVHITTGEYDPLSDEFIDMINSKQNFWRAGRNFHKDTPSSYFKNLMGVINDEISINLLKLQLNDEIIADLPKHFDARDKWPNCPSLNEIRDQGACGSCWAFAAVGAMTDRYCIFSNGTKQFHFSAQDVLSCSGGGGCDSGFNIAAWKYWEKTGIVSGGNYNSNEGCRPYEIPMCEHHVPGDLPPCAERSPTPECVKSCKSGYNVAYKKDRRRGKPFYSIDADEHKIKAEIFKNGPVQASFVVYTDFHNYKEGVYKHIAGEKRSTHAVKLLGWGVENGIKYWLAANSWNPNWGAKGFFKILRGENHCDIEEYIIAGKPLIK